MEVPDTIEGPQEAAGFSMLELLIVVTMMTVVVGFAFMQIARARQIMVRTNAANQLTAWLEKTRLDSVRRRPMTTTQMAQVSILDATSYSVTVDSNGDGALDAARVVSLPADADVRFSLPYPRVIYFNWRGRTVDSAGNIANPSFVNLTSSYGSSRIDLTSEGQSTLDGPPVSSAVLNSPAPSPGFRNHTQVP